MRTTTDLSFRFALKPVCWFGAAAILLCTLTSALSVAVMATPLDRVACAALKEEHDTLVDPNMAADVEKGADWAKENLGQLRLQKIERLFAVEEQLAFRCRGIAVADAILIPTLRTAVTPPAVSAGRGQVGGGLRVSTVPPPVRRPDQNTGVPNATAVVRSATQPEPNKADPSKSRSAIVKTVPSTPAQPGAQKKPELPKVIRLQNSENKEKADAAAKVKRNSVKRVRKPRRKRKSRRDAYVPPPPNPGYQPSLTTP